MMDTPLSFKTGVSLKKTTGCRGNESRLDNIVVDANSSAHGSSRSKKTHSYQRKAVRMMDEAAALRDRLYLWRTTFFLLTAMDCNATKDFSYIFSAKSLRSLFQSDDDRVTYPKHRASPR